MFQGDYIEQQGIRWIRPEETLKRDRKDSESDKAWDQKEKSGPREQKFLELHP